jgi:hypothetical protein
MKEQHDKIMKEHAQMEEEHDMMMAEHQILEERLNREIEGVDQM